MPANDRQVGGDHYKHVTPEPWDIVHLYDLGYFDGNAVKYLLRWRHKGGVEDLKKAIHYIEKQIEIQTEGQQRPGADDR